MTEPTCGAYDPNPSPHPGKPFHTNEQQPKGEAYEYINHPSHYNAHPSGVEAIVMCEVMEFNPGNTFKYIYRAGEKGNALQDLKKAMWYAEREYQRLSALAALPIYILRKFQSNILFTEEHDMLATTIVRAEPDRNKAIIYTNLFDRVSVKERRSQMMTVCVYLEGMIKTLSETTNKEQ